MLICDGQNRIKLRDIIDEVNDIALDVVSVATALNVVVSETNTNTSGLADHEARLALVEGSGGSLTAISNRVLILESLIPTIEQDVATNASDIADASVELATMVANLATVISNISTIESDIVQAKLDIDDRIKHTDALSPVNQANKVMTQDDFMDEINKISTSPIDLSVNRLVAENEVKNMFALKNYSIVKHLEPQGVNGGTSIAGAWTPRTLNTAFDDNLGILKPGNVLNLKAGDYFIDGFVVETGEYHQCRVYDITGAAELTVGSSGIGTSFLNSSFTLLVDSDIRIESQVDVATSNDGFGKANPFGSGVFSEIKIRKLGV